jgi:hypothetical protein
MANVEGMLMELSADISGLERKLEKRIQRSAKYSITYSDPDDILGLHDKVWFFLTLADAKKKQADLAVFWNVSKREIPIRKL